MPRGHIRDMGIISHLLNIKNVDDLKAYPNFGRLGEAFVTEQIIKGLFQYPGALSILLLPNQKSNCEINPPINPNSSFLPIDHFIFVPNKTH